MREELVDRAEEELSRALELAPESPICAYELACVAARRGDMETALGRLERAIEAGWDDAALAQWDEYLRLLRHDVRFSALCERMSARATASTTSSALPGLDSAEKPRRSSSPVEGPARGHVLLDGLEQLGRDVHPASTSSRERALEVLAPPRALHAPAFSPDGALLLARWGHRGGALLWDLETREPVAADAEAWRRFRAVPRRVPDRTRPWGSGAVRHADDPAERRELREDEQHGLRMWRGVEPLYAVRGDPRSPYRPREGRFHPDGELFVATQGERAIDIYDVRSGERLGTLDDGAVRVHARAWSADGELLALACADGTARVVDLRTGAAVRVLATGPGACRSVDFEPGSARLLTGNEAGPALLWDLAMGTSRRVGGPARSSSLASFHPDGELLLLAGAGEDARLVSVADGELVARLSASASDTLRCAWSPSGRHLATWEGDWRERRSDVALWSLGSRVAVTALDFGALVTAATFDAAGRYLAVGGADFAKAVVWAIETGELVGSTKLEWFEYPPVSALAFVPGTERLIVGTEDGGIILWDVLHGERAWLWNRNLGGSAPMSFSLMPEGDRLLVSGYGRRPCVVELSTGRVLARRPERSSERIAIAPSGALFGDGSCATTWYDAAGVELARRTECAGGGHVTVTPDGWCAGDLAGLRRHWARVSEQVVRLDELAPELLAPRKVAAVLAGVEVTPPRASILSKKSSSARR